VRGTGRIPHRFWSFLFVLVAIGIAQHRQQRREQAVAAEPGQPAHRGRSRLQRPQHHLSRHKRDSTLSVPNGRGEHLTNRLTRRVPPVWSVRRSGGAVSAHRPAPALSGVAAVVMHQEAG